MLARFVTGASFSSESRGGGSESNSKFLPFMIQIAHHLLEQGILSQHRSITNSVASYIISVAPDSKLSTPTLQPVMGTEVTIQFMMVNSLLSESYESWLQHRRGFLQHGIYHAYMQHTHGRSPVHASSSTTVMTRVELGSTSKSPNTETVNTDDLFVVVRPMLVYTGLIEQLQHFFKVSSKAKRTSIGTEDESRGLEGWEVVMKEKLINITEMIGLAKELVSWLNEMNSATDLQETFDIIGVLADVLFSGITLCEDFVQAAIDAGKS